MRMISAPTENERIVTGMTEYIESEACIKAIENDLPEQVHYSREDAADCILYIIASDVAPIRHGRWINAYPNIESNPMFMYGICSECGFEQGISKYLNYCPNCGAKMDLKD